VAGSQSERGQTDFTPFFFN